jgi:hypothetical protein
MLGVNIPLFYYQAEGEKGGSRLSDLRLMSKPVSRVSKTAWIILRI